MRLPSCHEAPLDKADPDGADWPVPGSQAHRNLLFFSFSLFIALSISVYSSSFMPPILSLSLSLSPLSLSLRFVIVNDSSISSLICWLPCSPLAMQSPFAHIKALYRLNTGSFTLLKIAAILSLAATSSYLFSTLHKSSPSRYFLKPPCHIR